MSVSVYWPLCVLCVFLRVISIQSTSKKLCHALDLSKLTPYCMKHAEMFVCLFIIPFIIKVQCNLVKCEKRMK